MARGKGCCLGGCLRSVIIFLLIVVGLPLYMILEARSLTTTSSTVRLKDLPAALDGLTVAFASDLHAGRYYTQKDIARDVDAINALGADLILLGGDYVANDVEADLWAYDEMARLSAPLGVWAVPGNHDLFEGAGRMRAGMEKAGIRLLENESVGIEHGGADLTLIGADFSDTGYARAAEITRGVPESALCILLAHDPKVISVLREEGLDARVDLSLAGHTHGGQFSFFGLFYATDIPLLFHEKIPRDLVRGWSRQSAATHLTTRGMGGHIPLRFLSPPEVHLITLARED